MGRKNLSKAQRQESALNECTWLQGLEGVGWGGVMAEEQTRQGTILFNFS